MAPGLGGMAFYTCKQFMHLKIFTSNEKAIHTWLFTIHEIQDNLFISYFPCKALQICKYCTVHYEKKKRDLRIIRGFPYLSIANYNILVGQTKTFPPFG